MSFQLELPNKEYVRVIVTEPTILKMRYDHFRKKYAGDPYKPLAGNFSRLDWLGPYCVLQSFKDALAPAISKALKEHQTEFGLRISTEEELGWSCTAEFHSRTIGLLELFKVEDEYQALKIEEGKNALLRPTSQLTMVCEIRYTPACVEVYVHALYPGPDVGESGVYMETLFFNLGFHIMEHLG